MAQGAGNAIAGFLQGLGNSYMQFQQRKHEDELRKEQWQMQIFQDAANTALQRGDMEALGRIFKAKSEYLQQGSGSKGAKGKEDIVSHLGDLLLNGVQGQDRLDSELQPLQQTAGAGQMNTMQSPMYPNLPAAAQPITFQQGTGMPQMEPTRPSFATPAVDETNVLTPKEATMSLGARVNPTLTPKPFFRTNEDILNEDINRLRKTEEVKSEFRMKELNTRLAAAKEQTMARLHNALQVAGVRNTAQYTKKLNEMASIVAAERGGEIGEVDIQEAGRRLGLDALDKHNKAIQYIAKMKDDMSNAKVRLQQNQQKINDWLKVNERRNEILAASQGTREGQLQLSKEKFDFQKTVTTQLGRDQKEFSGLVTRLNELNTRIAVATEKGDDTSRDEAISEAIQVKTRMGQLQASIDNTLGSISNEGAAVPATSNDPRIGKTVTDANGRRYIVTGISPEGKLITKPLE